MLLGWSTIWLSTAEERAFGGGTWRNLGEMDFAARHVYEVESSCTNNGRNEADSQQEFGEGEHGWGRCGGQVLSGGSVWDF